MKNSVKLRLKIFIREKDLTGKIMTMNSCLLFRLLSILVSSFLIELDNQFLIINLDNQLLVELFVPTFLQ